MWYWNGLLLALLVLLWCCSYWFLGILTNELLLEGVLFAHKGFLRQNQHIQSNY